MRILKDGLAFLIVGFATSTLTISFLPLHSARIISVLAIFIVLIILCEAKVLIRIKGLTIYSILLFFVLYSGFSTVLSNSADLVFFKKSISLLIDGVPCSILIAVVLIYKNKLNDFPQDRAFYDFCTYYFWFSVLISITVLISFLNPDFRTIAEGLFPAQGNITDSSHPDYLYRVRGILPATGASASVYFAFGIVLGLIETERLVGGSFFKSLTMVFGFFSLIFALTLNGRSGFVVLLIGVIIFSLNFIYKVLANYRISIKTVFRARALLLVVVSTIAFLVYPLFGDSKAIDRLTEDVGLIISSGGSKGTTGALMEMYFLPSSSAEFLFGDVSTFNSNRIPSDAGYVRVLHAIGILGFIIFYLFWFSSYLIIFISKISARVKASCFFLIVAMFVLELKEPFFLYLYSSIIIMVPISIYCLSPRIESRMRNE